MRRVFWKALDMMVFLKGGGDGRGCRYPHTKNIGNPKIIKTLKTKSIGPT
jgi:hypothetical protein